MRHSLAPGEGGIQVWRDMRDEFSAVLGRLELVLKLFGSKSSVVVGGAPIGWGLGKPPF